MNRRKIYKQAVAIITFLIGITFAVDALYFNLGMCSILGNSVFFPSDTNVSGQITYEEDTKSPPLRPGSLEVTPVDSGIILEWPGNGEGIVSFYKLYRKTTEGGEWKPLRKWWMTMIVFPEENNRDIKYSYTDRSAKKSQEYFYGVSTVVFCNESEITKSPVVNLFDIE